MSDTGSENEELIPTLTSVPSEQAVLTPLQSVMEEDEPPSDTGITSSSVRGDKIFGVAGAIMVMAIVVAGSVLNWSLDEQGSRVVASAPLVVYPEKPSVPNPYNNLSLEGRAAAVYDVRAEKLLYTLNEKESLPLASITKLMTALVATESSNKGMNVAISPHAIDTEGDSGLFANESWKLKDLVSFTMLTSSNDGADALAAAVGSLWASTPETMPDYKHIDAFVGRMNIRAKQMGLSNTVFTNATGLDEFGGRDGGEGSAEDIAHLLTYIWENEPGALEDTTLLSDTYISLDGFAHPASNTNEYVYSTPGLLGSKTGYTDRAGGNLSILYNAGLDHPIAVVVLGSTLEGRFTDVDMLVDATYEYVESGWYEYEVAGSSLKI